MRPLSGLMGTLAFALAVLTFGALRPGYSHLQQMMSELGERGAPLALGFNLLGFLPAGALLALFGLQLAHWSRQQGQTPGPGLLIALHGLGMGLASVLSCDPGCNPTAPSAWQIGHNLLAAIKFPALIAAALWLGISQLQQGRQRAVGLYSIATALLAIALLGLFIRAMALHTAPGGWQRLFLGTLYVWLAAISVWQWRGRKGVADR